MAKYKEIREKIKVGRFTSFYDFELSLDELADSLTKLSAELKARGYKDVRIDTEYSEYESIVEFYGVRLETDKERKTRLAKARKERDSKLALKEAEKEKELKELARLKAKYE